MYSVEVLLDPNFPTGQADPEAIADAGLVAATSDQGGTPNYVGINFSGAAFKATAPRNSDSIYLAVNNRGHSVGVRGFHASAFLAVFSDGTALTDLPVPSPSSAVGINDFEEVVGWDTSDARGFLLDRRSGALSRIPPPPGMTVSAPKAINAPGEVVGETDSGSFVFAAGASRSLGAFDAMDLNNQGLACGSVAVGTALTPALCDTRQASPAATPQPIPAGFAHAHLLGVNDSGVAVGQAWGANLASSIAFICVDGVSTDLNSLVETPGWNLIAAKAINNAGQIVGLGWINQRLMGFIATRVRRRRPFELSGSLEQLVAVLLGGIAVDGGGYVVIGGKPRPEGPWGPLHALSNEKRDALLALALDEAARNISDAETRASVRKVLLKAAERHAKALVRASEEEAAPEAGDVAAPVSRKAQQLLARRKRRR